MTLPRRGRMRQDAWHYRIYVYLRDHRGEPTVEQIASALRASEPRVRAGLKQLRQLGYVDGTRVIQDELLPAYLFLGIPEHSKAQVERFVASLRPDARLPVRAVQLPCDLVVHVRVFDLDGLHFLCEMARRRGADTASGVLLKQP